jgi:transcription elongation factor SPT6
LLLESQAEKVARLDAAYHDAEAAAAAAEAAASGSDTPTTTAVDPAVLAASEKKMCLDKLWHYGDYSEYVLTILEYRHVMDMKGYLNLIKEGNDAIKDKASALGGSSNKDKDKKKRSRRFDWDYYRTCVSEGLRNICYKFVLPPFRAGIKLEDTLTSSSGFLYERTLPGEGTGEEGEEFGDPKQWIAPKIEGSSPQDFASELIGSGELVLLSTARDDAAWDDNPEMDDPLRGCRYVAAMELAHEPRIRRHLRDIYRSEVVVTTRPTSKGIGAIDAFHEYYGLHLLRNKPVKDHFPMDEAELEKKRARLNAEELKELDDELKKKETNSCIQYLNILNAERSGDITVQVHLPFIEEMSDVDTPWYKRSADSMGRDRQDIGRLMEALERVYFPADGDADAWNDERRKILKMAIVNYLLPQFEAETRRDLRDASIRIGVEAAARNLHAMAMEGPYRPSHMLGDNRFIVPTGELPIVGVCSSTDPRDGTFLAAVNSVGELNDHLAIPGGTSITSEKMREKVITFLMQTRPSALVVGSSGGVGTRLTVRRLNEVVIQATERWNNRFIQGQDEDDDDFEARMQTFRMMNPTMDDEDDEDVWKCTVDIVDDNVAQLFGRSVRGKKEFPEAAVNLKIAVATARWAKDPLCELAYTWSTASDAGVFGTEMLFMNIHPLQRLLPKPLLLRQYERVLCDVTAEVGVDINAACTHDHMQGLLTFVPGLGPRKASNLKQSLARIGGVCSSRKSLLAKRLLGPIVYNNAVAFLRVRETEQLQDQMLHPLDDTRCHPDVYQRHKWAVKIAIDALEIGETATNNEDVDISAIRDVMQNSRDEVERLYNATKMEWERQYGATFNVNNWDPREAVPADQWRDKVEELDLDTFAEMIVNLGNGKWLSHLTMVKWEFRMPFEDPRKPMEPPTGEKLFKLLTGENDVTLCPGKEVTGKVVKNGDFGSQVKLEGEIPGFIPLRNLSDDHVESAEDIVAVGTIVTAIITELKMDHVCVDLTLKMEDFKKKSSEWGRPASLPPLDSCFDRMAALKIDEEKDKERESRLQALRLTATTKLGADPNAAEKAALRSGKVTRRACAHPAFRNASHNEVERELKEAGDTMVGEALIRPSNKSVDSLAIHWMVRPGCVKVIEVLEEDKDTEASIGNRLIIKV